MGSFSGVLAIFRKNILIWSLVTWFTGNVWVFLGVHENNLFGPNFRAVFGPK